MKIIRIWIYTRQMCDMLFHLYPTAKQVSEEVFEIQDTEQGFCGSQDYCGDMCGRCFSVVP